MRRTSISCRSQLHTTTQLYYDHCMFVHDIRCTLYDVYIMYSPQCLSLAVVQATNAGVRRPGYEARVRRPGYEAGVSLSECICGKIEEFRLSAHHCPQSRLQNYNTGTVTAAAQWVHTTSAHHVF